MKKQAQPLGVGMDVGERVGVGAVGEQVRGVPAQRGDRVSQLVRRIGDEAALGLAGLLERGEHPVQRLGEAVDLIGARPTSGGEAQRGVTRALDHGGAGRQPLERAQGAARRGAARAGMRARQRAALPRRSAGATARSSVSFTSSVDAATITAPPPAGPPRSESGAT